MSEIGRYEQPFSLIKYEPAVQIHSNMRSYHKDQQNQSEEFTPKVQDIMNSIIPPRDWNDSMDKLYIQYVSHQPATREDVLELRERLERILEDRQARKFGVCPIREQLYSQVFDEIIRQVAVDCPERGLLLMRVRDEHKMTMAAYQTIYQASIIFGMKKQVESQDGTQQLQKQIQTLEEKQTELQNKRDMLICQKDLLERQIRERNSMFVMKRQEEIKFLDIQTENLKKFLDAVKSQIK